MMDSTITQVPAAESSGTPSSKKNTITRLLKMARQEFAGKGLAGARVDDIARAAGVTKQLVYHYFLSKEHLLACVLNESAEAVLAELLALDFAHLPPIEAMRELLNHVFDQYRDDPSLGTLAIEGLRFHERGVSHARFPELVPGLTTHVGRILQRGVQSGEFRAGTDPRLFFAAASLITTGGFTNRYTLSAVAGFDTAAPDGAAAWRRYSVDFVLAAILADHRPMLARPQFHQVAQA
jgi:AcrR family transcriptional regulator